MLYAGVFTRFPNITFVIAPAAGTLPLLAGRLALLGAEPWVPNLYRLSTSDITTTLRRLWADTAASAGDQQPAAAATFGDLPLAGRPRPRRVAAHRGARTHPPGQDHL